MTAKEKAKELVEKYLNIEFCLLTDNQAKQCALICVDEIVSEHLDEGINSYVQKRIDYWSEVKQEINKQNMKNIKYIGMAIGIIAMSLAWMWFGWRMPLVIFLALMGNNMERIK